MKTNTILPSRKIHKTPRLLVCDAYTFGSQEFESNDAKHQAEYYVTYRKKLHSVNPAIYAKDDHRIIAIGLQRILEYLFYEPITHAEIDEAKRFCQDKKVTTKGLAEYAFPEKLWRRVVDEFNGRPPITIQAVPEGSVVYPNEPIVIIDNKKAPGFGQLSAWFESKILQMWAPSEVVSQDQHFLLRLKERVRRVDPTLSEEEVTFFASITLHDFSDRAGMNFYESEDMGMYALYTFGGTDTWSGAYQAWKNSGEAPGVAVSVNALAHRNVQSYQNEADCYRAIYDAIGNGEYGSMVADCYDFKNALYNHLVPLALESVSTGNGKVVVARPDSSKPGYTDKDQVIDVCETAVRHGLYTEKNGFKYSTTLKFIEGNGMNHETILEIIDELIERKFAFFSWGLFGMGGGRRNGLMRDNTSAKYALASVGFDEKSVVKFSETAGKTTIPGPFKLLRSAKALLNKETVVFAYEDGENAMVEYFDGTRIVKPFGPGMDDDFNTIKARIAYQMQTMPLNLERADSGLYSASKAILAKRDELLELYAPQKQEIEA